MKIEDSSHTKVYKLNPYSHLYSPILSVITIGLLLYYVTSNTIIIILGVIGTTLFQCLLKQKAKVELDIYESEITVYYINYCGFKWSKKYSLKESKYSFKTENISKFSKREVLRIKKNDRTIVKLVSSENGITVLMLLEIVTIIENDHLSIKAKY